MRTTTEVTVNGGSRPLTVKELALVEHLRSRDETGFPDEAIGDSTAWNDAVAPSLGTDADDWSEEMYDTLGGRQ